MHRRGYNVQPAGGGVVRLIPHYPRFGGGFEVYWAAELRLHAGLYYASGTAPTRAEAEADGGAYLEAVRHGHPRWSHRHAFGPCRLATAYPPRGGHA